MIKNIARKKGTSQSFCRAVTCLVVICAEGAYVVEIKLFWGGKFILHVRNYIRCAIPEDSCRQGDVVTGRITGFLTDEILEVSIEE